MKINEILTEDIEQLDELNWKKAAADAATKDSDDASGFTKYNK